VSRGAASVGAAFFPLAGAFALPFGAIDPW
jgi:hypothetical protein